MSAATTTSLGRRVRDRVMTSACGFAVVCALLPLLSLLALVLSRGLHGLSLGFFTRLPAPVGEPSGMGNALAGTFFLVGLASLIGVPLGLGAGLFLAERGEGRAGRVVRFCAEILAAVPSIVVGVVVYVLVVMPMGRFSALAGAIALALIMAPTLARATEEMVRLVPRPLREASLALGVPAWRTTLRIVLRTALPGLVNACLLVVARAAGETAPLLFTSLNNPNWSFRPDLPTASLTVQIYNYAGSVQREWVDQAWTAALVLLVLVGGISLLARRLAERSRGGRL